MEIKTWGDFDSALFFSSAMDFVSGFFRPGNQLGATAR
jgi:hypothetical protein